MKGIILAGGNGTRLFPITRSTSKQLIPVYDKPMIYYPLSVLMLSSIKDILIITNEQYLKNYKDLLNDGSHLGINISYKIQKNPEGIAQSFIIADEFIGNESVALILGDNIFYGEKISFFLNNDLKNLNSKNLAIIFGYEVVNAHEYGVAEIDKKNNVLSIEEKPKNPKSNISVTGFYIYPNDVIEFSKTLKPSKRNELEITDLNNIYLKQNRLILKEIGKSSAWFDMGTPDGLLDASNFIQTVEKRQGLKIACIEEIALQKKFIDILQFKDIIKNSPNNYYKKYLTKILNEK